MISTPSKLIWMACAEFVYLIRGERVATCIEGPANRLNPSILQSMRRHLLDPTESDLFVYAPYVQSKRDKFEENASSTYLDHIHAQLEHLGPAVQSRVTEDLTRPELTKWFLDMLDMREHAVPGQKDFWYRFCFHLPFQLASQIQSKSFKNRCQDACPCWLRFLIWYGHRTHLNVFQHLSWEKMSPRTNWMFPFPKIDPSRLHVFFSKKNAPPNLSWNTLFF